MAARSPRSKVPRSLKSDLGVVFALNPGYMDSGRKSMTSAGLAHQALSQWRGGDLAECERKQDRGILQLHSLALSVIRDLARLEGVLWLIGLFI